MSRSGEPALTVIAVTQDEGRTLRPIVAALTRQSIADRIQLVIVAPTASISPHDLGLEPSTLHSIEVVGIGQVRNRGRSAAAGVAKARAPIVALTENHCYPMPDWAEALLQVHSEGPWAAVGPAVINANPESALSVAMHATGYGAFAPDMAAEDRPELPLHNSSYRTESLLAFGDRLPDLLADERGLQRALIDAGERMRFDPRPVKRHINEATWKLLGGIAYCGGRRYGGYRCRDWSLIKRLAYAAAGPLLVLPIWRTARGKAARVASGALPFAVSRVLVGWAAIHALGEVVSYLVGGSPLEFRNVESDEFMIRERLGGRRLTDPDIAALVATLDRFPERPGVAA